MPADKNVKNMQKNEKKPLESDVVKKYIAYIATVDAFEEYKHIVNSPNTPTSTEGKKQGKDGRVNGVKAEKKSTNANIQGTPYALAKKPETGNIAENEKFWNKVFERKCSLHLLVSSDEEKDLKKMFKTTATGDERSMIRFKTLSIDTRKVETDILQNSKVDKYYIEILPMGCSNSFVTEIYVHKNWQEGIGPKDLQAFHQAARFLMDSSSSVTSAGIESTVMLCSSRGYGRNGSLLALATAIRTIEEGKVPDMMKIVMEMRENRPGAVETDHQYTTVYLAINAYVMSNMPLECDKNFVFKAVSAFGDKMAAIARKKKGVYSAGGN